MSSTNSTLPMSVKERIFHAVLFEVGAVLVSILVIKLFGSHDTSSATFVSVLMAIIAMAWNFIFNWGFDKFFPGDRLERGVGLRIFHVILFEAGLLVATVPLIAYILEVTLWQAFMMDLSLTIAITIYAFIFNWAYDYIRVKVLAR